MTNDECLTPNTDYTSILKFEQCVISLSDEVTGTCVGDSGGPIISKSNHTSKNYELIGAVKGARWNCATKNFPSFFTRF